MSADNSGDYTPIPNDYSGDTERLLSNESEPLHHAPNRVKESARTPAFVGAVTLTLLALLLSLASNAILGLSQGRLQSRLGDANISELRRPSVYPRLSSIEPDPKGPNTLFPRAMIQISRDEPTQAFGKGSTVLIKADARSMIMQYRLADTDFYMCSVEFIVPLPSKNTKTVHLSGNTSSIEVWNLTSPGLPETLEGVTWATRPPRQHLVGTLNATQSQDERALLKDAASGGKIMTDRFACHPGSWHVLELACGSTDCFLQFDQLFTYRDEISSHRDCTARLNRDGCWIFILPAAQATMLRAEVTSS